MWPPLCAIPPPWALCDPPCCQGARFSSNHFTRFSSDHFAPFSPSQLCATSPVLRLCTILTSDLTFASTLRTYPLCFCAQFPQCAVQLTLKSARLSVPRQHAQKPRRCV
ncbi:hypothetical protein M407DRAFT_172376 [Tulasnella calospora MUT 4182]|uniref:Uncharacterized protein n=1 Tax=Tulasnella calospora MUT 4182 TaxID=1051891 RepID=A0A0C3Q3X6_9AGAM|nr:hypothetical protein M407DRAFT_172376 [Tulasnella calospora MUT 4182]